ncbi:PREDICTED: uncharacterized protein LOC106898508 [Calidris pugnax]|uniref:uncharacterized protein LOC106898508 n=1 Tax=Calidris pugnax TaxID=198806 RepID=UPI00071CB4DE|nr:PREDICTED: uncharacterized protein LOC106898508 [Calidris pugnax]
MNLLTQVNTLVQTLRDPDGPFLQTWRWLCSWVGSSRQGSPSVPALPRTTHLTPGTRGPNVAQPAFPSAPMGAQHLEERTLLAGFPHTWRPKLGMSLGWGMSQRVRDAPVSPGAPESPTGPQGVAGAVSTAAFFLCEGLLGQHFDVVPDGMAQPQPGDLFLFPLASGGPGWWGAHAGVYCGDGEIIHLEGSLGTSPLGIVAKHSKSHLLRTRGPAKVLRRKGGLDAASLQRRIRAAMDQAVEYDAITCNCVHFALALLGLGQLAGATVFPALQ